MADDGFQMTNDTLPDVCLRFVICQLPFAMLESRVIGVCPLYYVAWGSRMITKFVLPLAAVLGIALGVFSVLPVRVVYSASPLEVSLRKKTTPVSRPVQDPPQQPTGLEKTIAGAGLVEARMENIPIGTAVPGVVMEVYVDGRR